MKKRQHLGESWARILARSLLDNDIQLARSIKVIPSYRLMTFMTGLLNPADLPKVTKLGEELALVLGAESCRVSRHFGALLFEVPLPTNLWRTLPIEGMDQKGGLWLALGKTSLQAPVYCKLDSPCVAPILVAGRTGAGKTEALKTMLWELASSNSPDKLRFVIYDPKGKFRVCDNLAHLELPILRTPEEAVPGIAYLLRTLSDRMDIEYPEPRIVFIVDELLELMRVDSEAIGKSLGRLASLGREKGIHLMLATQRPDRKHLDKVGAANIGLRIVGRVADTTEATLAAGMGGTGAHLLSNRGDMLLVMSGTVCRMQMAMISDASLEELPHGIANAFLPEIGTADLTKLLRGANTQVSPLYSSAELATALTDVGILKLKQSLSMGQPRATRLRAYAGSILEELAEQGYDVKEVE